MSFHYEVVFSVDLRDETPDEVLDELRWHLGLTVAQPAKLSFGRMGRLLQPNKFSYLPGGEVARLERYLKHRWAAGDHHVYGLFVRLNWQDDQFADCWLPVVEFLTPHVESDGYAGFFRTEYDLIPDVLIFRNGHRYLLETNGVPKSIDNDGPEWVRFDHRGRPE